MSVLVRKVGSVCCSEEGVLNMRGACGTVREVYERSLLHDEEGGVCGIMREGC